MVRHATSNGSCSSTIPLVTKSILPSAWGRSLAFSETAARPAPRHDSHFQFAADAKPPDVSISETVDYVIVDHADRLHVCVDHGRSHKTEPAALEITAECVRLGGRCGNLAQRTPAILSWPAIDK